MKFTGVGEYREIETISPDVTKTFLQLIQAKSSTTTGRAAWTSLVPTASML